jgi:thioredoxin reductase (NADPH)
MSGMLDCLLIGGGPAGLTAAIYLGRFRRRIHLVDGGWSRAEWITHSHNLPGFPAGVGGAVLLERMREQALLYGATLRKGYVDTLTLAADGSFAASLGVELLTARTVILATGVVENKPPLPHFANAVKRGVLRTCPICDGYESMDKDVAVLGRGDHAAGEALFLRTYTDRLSLLLLSDDKTLSAGTAKSLEAAGIGVRYVDFGSVRVEGEGVTLSGADGQSHHFDVIYTAFGLTSQTALAQALGARLDASGRVYVNEHQETSIAGLFAAGDLVRGLNQVCVATGEAVIGATAIHNRLPAVPA